MSHAAPHDVSRRAVLRALGVIAAAPLAGCATLAPPGKKALHVVVVGGGFAGATAARYLRLWSGGRIAVTLIERESRFVSCPLSNLVLAGLQGMDGITHNYAALRDRWGVRVLTAQVDDIDVARRQIILHDGARLAYDRLVLAPGIGFRTDEIAGLAGHLERIPHAWKAGPQTLILRRQIEAMPDNGVFAMHIPRSPYRCPPGPYERACVVAHYLQARKPRAKLLVLDANGEIQSKKAFFREAFDTRYRGIIEYRPDSTLLAVDADRRIAELEFERVRADVLNVIPPMRAGRLADRLGVPLVNGHWVDVDWRSMEALGAPGVHVLGDATLSAPAMPKSGHMANQHAKHAAAAIVALLDGREPTGDTPLVNTCFSFLDDRRAVHVASMHRLDPQTGAMQPVAGVGGLSAAATEREGRYAHDWARAIWADMLGSQ